MAQLVACPECTKHLQVPDELMGKKVQCPECRHTFTATAPGDEGVTSSKRSSAGEWEKKSSSNVPSKRRRDDDDDDDDFDDDRSRRSRRRSSRRGNYTPHRGGMILAFGLIALIGGMVAGVPVVFGIIAWIMGNADLEEMRQGRMDPEGEGMTQAGRIMGMIATIITIVGLVIGLISFGVVGIMMLGCCGLMAAAQPPPGQRR